MGDRRRIKRERERKVGPTGRRLHDGIKSFVGINDNDDNEAACHRRVGRAIIVRRRIFQSLLGNLFFATGVRDNVPVFLFGSSDDILLLLLFSFEEVSQEEETESLKRSTSQLFI